MQSFLLTYKTFLETEALLEHVYKTCNPNAIFPDSKPAGPVILK
jgi:hypothetical protein